MATIVMMVFEWLKIREQVHRETVNKQQGLKNIDLIQSLHLYVGKLVLLEHL